MRAKQKPPVTAARLVTFSTLIALAAFGGARAQAAGQTYTDLVYANPSTSPMQKLDLYLPGGAASPVPLVIMIHGGGFLTGDKSGEVWSVEALLARGYAVASLNYRLTGDARFPAACQDVKAAVRWLRANAAAYGLDPNRFVAWGSSAGAYLAVLLGVTGDQATLFDDAALGNPGVSSAVQAVVDWFGPTDFGVSDAQQRAAPPKSCPDSWQQTDLANSPISLWLGGALPTIPATVAQANLTLYPASAKRLPAFFIAHGDDDCIVPFAQSVELHAALTAAGAASQLTIHPGYRHSDTRFYSTQAAPAFDFIDKALTPTVWPRRLLPVVLDVTGVGGSHYTTELTLASRAAAAVEARLLFTSSSGAGTGTVTVDLAAGETRVIPDAVAFLRSGGLAIPAGEDIVGTLDVTFAGALDAREVFVGGRTFTPGGGGTFGLFYPGADTTGTTATLVGLRQDDAQRSNVALVNAGDSSVVLRVQLTGPLGEDLGALPDVTLAPRGWAQVNRPLEGKASSGRATVSRVSGSAPFTAYGVLNDAVTSDGSFVSPLPGGISGGADRLVPIVLDAYGVGGSHYRTELTLANLGPDELPVTLAYTAALGTGSGSASLTLAAGEQRLIADVVAHLRSAGLAIPADGSSVGGALLVTMPAGTPASSCAVGARTFTPAASGKGTFGLYTPGLTLLESATSEAFVHGLQQGSTQRSNLALVNRGDAGDSITLSVSLFDAAGASLGAATEATLAPGQWTQLGQPLAASGANVGYARIEKTSGTSRFVAYGVLNDAVTSDGSYIPMSF